MRSVLITGGTGYFGRAFARHALSTGAERVCIYSRSEHRQAEMREEMADERLRWLIGDVRDRDRLCRAMQGCEIVVHAAALKRIEVGQYNPEEMAKTNIGGAINVIEAARSAGVSKVVALSTDKAYEPISPYGQSKALAESLFLAANHSSGAYGPRFAVCRYGNVAGSTGSVIPRWRHLLCAGRAVPVTDPECTRFWMSRHEAVALVAETIAKMRGGELCIPTLPAFRLGDLAAAMGAQMEIIGLPAWEKKHESMSPQNSSDKARRMSVEELRDQIAEMYGEAVV